MTLRSKLKCRSVTTVTIACVIIVAACSDDVVGHDPAGVTEFYDQYRQAWLRNDDSVPEAVMSLFAKDATLMPHHGDPMVIGRDAIAEHWFPEGQVFGTVDDFVQDVKRVEVSGELGYLYGRFDLTFTYAGSTTSVDGNQLMVVRRDGGEWKIVALIWNDPPN